MPRSYIIDDPLKKRFLLDREALVSPSVLQEEISKIFAKCWIYVGHSSELKKPNDFVTRKVAGRPVIFNRDARGENSLLPEYLPAPGRHCVHRTRGFAAQFPLCVSRLGLPQ